ncbi:flavin reductase family protein [Streptomyces sp. NBC_01089]|uniref:flavin reductase family protein n=1 Tax=Streptomyces sp. NBC_01089 TaxID=2903747 RepID=UPI00386FE80E|nr:flavin reductase family protein [Streptomyces sp. NBC_01089]
MDQTQTFDSREFRSALGHFASGVTIVTAATAEGAVGFTCQSFTSLSLEPPLVALAPGKSSTSWPHIREAGYFCVNVLAEAQEDTCLAFATSGADKFAGVDWAPGACGAPRLSGSLAHIECELTGAYDAGDHELVIGRVLDIDTRPGKPLLFYRGAFSRLGV